MSQPHSASYITPEAEITFHIPLHTSSTLSTQEVPEQRYRSTGNQAGTQEEDTKRVMAAWETPHQVPQKVWNAILDQTSEVTAAANVAAEFEAAEREAAKREAATTRACMTNDSDGGWDCSDRNGSERKEAISGRDTELPSEPSDNEAGETGRYDEH